MKRIVMLGAGIVPLVLMGQDSLLAPGAKVEKLQGGTPSRKGQRRTRQETCTSPTSPTTGSSDGTPGPGRSPTG